MPLLAAVADVIADLGYNGNMPNITAAVTAALQNAEYAIESALDTTFAQKQVTDTFLVRGPTMHRGALMKTEFRLSHGFVQSPLLSASLTSPSGLYNFFMQEVQSVPDVLNILANLSGDLEKGILVDQTNLYWQKIMTVTYNCGFAIVPDSSPEAYASVPQWLQFAAKLWAKISVQSNPSLEDPAIKMDTKLLQSELDLTLRRRARYAPVALIPDVTTTAAYSG